MGGGRAGGTLPLSSGPSSLAGWSQAQSAGVSAAMPCAIRALSHCGLGAPNSHDASTARQTLGRTGWMLQRERTPISASSATHRGSACEVPRITRSWRRKGSVSSRGTTPPSPGSASDQWKPIRKWAQQAPQVRQG